MLLIELKVHDSHTLYICTKMFNEELCFDCQSVTRAVGLRLALLIAQTRLVLSKNSHDRRKCNWTGFRKLCARHLCVVPARRAQCVRRVCINCRWWCARASYDDNMMFHAKVIYPPMWLVIRLCGFWCGVFRQAIKQSGIIRWRELHIQNSRRW